MKIAAGITPIYNGTALTYSSTTGKFELISVNKRNDDCEACGTKATLTKDLIDYDKFCRMEPIKPIKILSPEERITVQEYEQILKSGKKHILIDVRPQNHQDIVKLDNAFTITLEEIVTGSGAELVQKLADKLIETEPESDKHKIFVMCRRGIASQRGVRELQKRLKHGQKRSIRKCRFIDDSFDFLSELFPLFFIIFFLLQKLLFVSFVLLSSKLSFVKKRVAGQLLSCWILFFCCVMYFCLKQKFDDKSIRLSILLLFFHLFLTF